MAKKKKMSAAARKKMSLAAKRRWAAFRSGKSKTTAKRGRPPKAATSGRNPYLNMTVAEFVDEKRRLDEAWKTARKLLRG